jgi:succinate dehydrogenase flavin-adding protein (antitoxin of CptAB toxin-antitoxin module)
MSTAERELERIRWHCRRGMLELDLVLNAFVQRHLATLTPRELDTFRGILERPDPELLDLVMAHTDPEDTAERELIRLMRAVTTSPRIQPISA